MYVTKTLLSLLTRQFWFLLASGFYLEGADVWRMDSSVSVSLSQFSWNLTLLKIDKTQFKCWEHRIYAGRRERHEIFLKHHILEGSGRDNDKAEFCGKKQHCVAGILVISANTNLHGLLLYGLYVKYEKGKNCVCTDILYVRCENKDTINCDNFNLLKTSRRCKLFYTTPCTISNWNWGCETLGKGLSRSSLVSVDILPIYWVLL